jgi:hypothetical protein
MVTRQQRMNDFDSIGEPRRRCRSLPVPQPAEISHVFRTRFNGLDFFDMQTGLAAAGSSRHRQKISAIPASASILPRSWHWAPSCASHRRSSNANSLQGQNSAGFPQICAIFQGDPAKR